MSFQVPRPIFTLTIRLIDRLVVDVGTRRTSALVVRVDVIDEDDQPGICHIDGERRIEMDRLALGVRCTPPATNPNA